MSIVPTSVPNVFASPDALSLVEKFYSCPDVFKRLSSDDTIKPLSIVSTTEPSPSFSRRFSQIQIPEIELQMKKGLHSLAFEIFNAQDSLLDTINSAIRSKVGMDNVGMDAYAIEKVKHFHRWEAAIVCNMDPQMLGDAMAVTVVIVTAIAVNTIISAMYRRIVG